MHAMALTRSMSQHGRRTFRLRRQVAVPVTIALVILSAGACVSDTHEKASGGEEARRSLNSTTSQGPSAGSPMSSGSPVIRRSGAPRRSPF